MGCSVLTMMNSRPSPAEHGGLRWSLLARLAERTRSCLPPACAPRELVSVFSHDAWRLPGFWKTLGRQSLVPDCCYKQRRDGGAGFYEWGVLVAHGKQRWAWNPAEGEGRGCELLLQQIELEQQPRASCSLTSGNTMGSCNPAISFFLICVPRIVQYALQHTR